ncbi:hypothetical protein [Polaromonas sp. CG_9.2]|jgi:hypothetical protein|nr:hypothetical protein [Polaromonas sp. CG_9.2]MDH6185662.1 hypothetical protein [Polaromonas sp. CG_23.6]
MLFPAVFSNWRCLQMILHSGVHLPVAAQAMGKKFVDGLVFLKNC